MDQDKSIVKLGYGFLQGIKVLAKAEGICAVSPPPSEDGGN